MINNFINEINDLTKSIYSLESNQDMQGHVKRILELVEEKRLEQIFDEQSLYLSALKENLFFETSKSFENTDFNISLHDDDKLSIELKCWRKMQTQISSPAVGAVVYILRGKLTQHNYEFVEEKVFNDISLGKLKLKGNQRLYKSQGIAICESLLGIRSRNHLDSPTIVIEIKLKSNEGFGHKYIFPSLKYSAEPLNEADKKKIELYHYLLCFVENSEYLREQILNNLSDSKIITLYMDRHYLSGFMTLEVQKLFLQHLNNRIDHTDLEEVYKSHESFIRKTSFLS